MPTKPVTSIADDGIPGKPLAPWTYTNPELFELEYEAFFLRRWQFVGHVDEVREPGDFITGDIGRDNVFIIRDKSGELHAFLNVCRHRASRILEGSGSCRGVIRCPYHGWTYRLDGSLMAIPQEENFPHADRSKLGLHPVSLDVFHGLIFVRIKGEGRSVSEQFADSSEYFEKYGVADYEKCRDVSAEVWNVNWKVAWDNYLENYHIPIGHPSLYRLLVENDEWDQYSSGVCYGTFEIKDRLSRVEEERRYQELLHHADQRVPDDLRGKWVQFGMSGNLGIDLYPEMLDLFQLIPLAPDRTLIRASFYGHRNPTPEEEELRKLNVMINDPVNEEDRLLCARVQKGLRTHGYRPGPLSQLEIGIYQFHEEIRKAIPVASLFDEPPRGQVAAENLRLSAG